MNEMTIQQVAEETGLSVHTLRYYERVGLITPIDRASSGHRRYTEKDVNEIIFLTRLRSTNMPISDMKKYVDLMRLGSSSEAERLELLEAHRDAVHHHLEEVSKHLAKIEMKIRNYHNHREGAQKRRSAHNSRINAAVPQLTIGQK